MTNLYTVREFARKHSELFSEASLRYHIHNSEKREHSKCKTPNGLKPALIRVGRKILIKEDAFFDWVESHKGE